MFENLVSSIIPLSLTIDCVRAFGVCRVGGGGTLRSAWVEARHWDTRGSLSRSLFNCAPGFGARHPFKSTVKQDAIILSFSQKSLLRGMLMLINDYILIMDASKWCITREKEEDDGGK